MDGNLEAMSSRRGHRALEHDRRKPLFVLSVWCPRHYLPVFPLTQTINHNFRRPLKPKISEWNFCLSWPADNDGIPVGVHRRSRLRHHRGGDRCPPR